MNMSLERKLSVLAAYEVGKAAQHRGKVSNPVVWPYARAAVRFEPSAPAPRSFVVLLPNREPRMLSKVEAVEALRKSWLQDILDLKRADPGQYAQAVQIIEREYLRAAEALDIGSLLMQPVSARGGGGASVGGGVGCKVIGIVTIIIVAAIVGSAIIHALGEGSSVAAGTNTSGGGIGTSSAQTSSSDLSAQCASQPGFAGAAAAIAEPNFPDVPFPPSSLSYHIESTTYGGYLSRMIQVCSPALNAAGARSFFSSSMPNDGWTQSSTFPYEGDPNRSCGDPYCWSQGSSPTYYVSLELVTEQGSVALYKLRLGTLP